jgi:hypothetical protein
MANAMTRFKNHLPDLDVEILCKDFTIDDVEREALANIAYDATMILCPCMIFPASSSPMIAIVPRLCNFYLCYNKQ